MTTSLRSQLDAHRAQLEEHRKQLADWRAKFEHLDKQVSKMTKRELICVIARKDEELAVLRNRLAQYSGQEATSAQLSAALDLMSEVIHERRTT